MKFRYIPIRYQEVDADGLETAVNVRLIQMMNYLEDIDYSDLTEISAALMMLDDDVRFYCKSLKYSNTAKTKLLKLLDDFYKNAREMQDKTFR